MIIHSSFKDYEVSFQNDFSFVKELAKTENSQFVVDKNVYNLYSELFCDIPNERITVIEATEENKVMDTVLHICEQMTEIPAKRNATLISLGGGIIQDITGLVANILYRGVNWIFVPTTLLAACDSCIGGKTSLNYKKYKNLLGTFFPPDKLYICPPFFGTLTEKDFKSGLGEVIKFNIIAGGESFTKILEDMPKLLNRDPQTISDYVKKSLAFKKNFIEVDEFDKGERIKLNFAHTFGHAIEVVTDYKIPHGTAVAMGMVMANYISLKRGLIGDEFVEQSEACLFKVIDIDINLLEASMDKIIDAIRKDKKQTSTALTAVLLEQSGLKIVRDMTVQEVTMAFDHFKNAYKKVKEI